MVAQSSLARFILVLAGALIAPIAIAQSDARLEANTAEPTQPAESWQPPPPMPDDFDWVQLTSGEWLKGEIIALYQEKLEFDSKKLKLLSLDWEDIQELRSAGTMQVGLVSESAAVGQLFVDGETIRVLGEEDRQLPRSEVLTITAGEPKEINFWSFKASLGANLRRGNTEQIETTGSVNLIRRTTRSRIKLDYLATFNETDGLTATDNQRASASWSLYTSPRFFWRPLYGEWFRDPFQNISERRTLGAGIGYEIIDSSRTNWEVTVGPGYQSTRFDDVAEGESITADTAVFGTSTSYDRELTGWMDYLFDYRFFIVNEESGTYTHHLVTGLELEITRLLDFDISIIWDRTQDPQQDSEGVVPDQDDFRLVVALGLDY